jgi:2'-5' RNA ligase
VRLFVAIDLDDTVQKAVETLVQDLKQSVGELRWVRPEAMHLTLKFIGEVEENKLPPIREALTQVKAEAPAEIDCREVGFLPNERRPRVLYVAIVENIVLSELARKIEDALAPLGIEKEDRAFRPHLTLARFRKGNESTVPKLKEAIASLPSREFGKVRAEEFHLYQSELSSGGAKYTTLERFPFVAAPGNG